MSYYVLDIGYTMSGPAIQSKSAVVYSPNVREVALPAGSNAQGFAGIAVSSQSVSGRALTVRKIGIADAIAAGSIQVGSPLIIADGNGRVKTADEIGQPCECIGFAETEAAAAGDVVSVFICPHQRSS